MTPPRRVAALGERAAGRLGPAARSRRPPDPAPAARSAAPARARWPRRERPNAHDFGEPRRCHRRRRRRRGRRPSPRWPPPRRARRAAEAPGGVTQVNAVKAAPGAAAALAPSPGAAVRTPAPAAPAVAPAAPAVAPAAPAAPASRGAAVGCRCPSSTPRPGPPRPSRAHRATPCWAVPAAATRSRCSCWCAMTSRWLARLRARSNAALLEAVLVPLGEHYAAGGGPRRATAAHVSPRAVPR